MGKNMRKQYSSERLLYKCPDPQFACMASVFFEKNRKNFEKYEEKKPEQFFLPEFQQIWLEMQKEKIKEKEWYAFYIFKKHKPNDIIGTITISDIQYGAKKSGMIGYRIDEQMTGNGYGTEAAWKATELGFSVLGLHRMEADVMPKNVASIRILEKCGYKREGYFRKYIRINGIWEDHIHMAVLKEEFQKVKEIR